MFVSPVKLSFQNVGVLQTPGLHPQTSKELLRVNSTSEAVEGASEILQEIQKYLQSSKEQAFTFIFLLKLSLKNVGVTKEAHIHRPMNC